MSTIFEKSFLMSLGLLSMTHEKAKKIANELMKRGEIQKDEVKEWTEKLAKRGEEEREAAQKIIRDELKKAIAELGLVTKQDIQELINKIDELSAQSKN